MLRIDKTFYRS